MNTSVVCVFAGSATVGSDSLDSSVANTPDTDESPNSVINLITGKMLNKKMQFCAVITVRFLFKLNE